MLVDEQPLRISRKLFRFKRRKQQVFWIYEKIDSCLQRNLINQQLIVTICLAVL